MAQTNLQMNTHTTQEPGNQIFLTRAAIKSSKGNQLITLVRTG